MIRLPDRAEIVDPFVQCHATLPDPTALWLGDLGARAEAALAAQSEVAPHALITLVAFSARLLMSDCRLWKFHFEGLSTNGVAEQDRCLSVRSTEVSATAPSIERRSTLARDGHDIHAMLRPLADELQSQGDDVLTVLAGHVASLAMPAPFQCEIVDITGRALSIRARRPILQSWLKPIRSFARR